MLLRAVTLAAALGCAAAASAQSYEFPKTLDVPYVPTGQPTVEAMLRLATVGPGDYVVDLGSGDGRIVITAARLFGARGFGVDLDPQRISESERNAKIAGVTARVRFQHGSVFDAQFSQASVVTLYLLPKINLQLRPRLLTELKPGTRVVAHDFDMGNWRPDITASVRGQGSTVYFWVVPAQIAGRWNLRFGGAGSDRMRQLEIVQEFQEITVNASEDGKPRAVHEERLEGDRIGFVLVDDADYLYRYRFEGRIEGGEMTGTAHGEGSAPRASFQWRASRAVKASP